MYRWFETRIDAFPDEPPARPPDSLWGFYAYFIRPVWPAFALLLTAAGVGLLMEEDPPRIAYHLSCIGIGIYLAGTRAFLLASTRRATLVRLAMLIATFGLGRLDLDPHSYVVLLAGWTVGAAALTSASYGGDEEQRVQRVIAERERDVRS